MTGSTRPFPAPMRGRPGPLLLALLLALIPAMGACSSRGDEGDRNGAPEPNAWQRVMAMTGPNGEVGTGMALTAFATAFGPLPGASSAPGDTAGLRSGSAALRWIAGHWWDITPEQRQAVGAVFGGDGLPGPEPEPPRPRPTSGPASEVSPDAGPAGAGAAYALPRAEPEAATCPENTPASPVYAARLRAWWTRLAVRLAMPDPIAIAACATDAPFTGGSGPPRVSVPTSARGWNHPSGPQCRVMLHPLFRSREISEARRDEFLVHELAHCFQGILLDNPGAYAVLPAWVGEGLADWISAKLVGHYGDTGWWQRYLIRMTPSLRNQAYEAVGFWWELEYRGVDVWSVVRSVTVVAAAGGDRHDDKAFEFALAGKRQDVLEGWPSSFLRDQARELAWDTAGVGITDHSFSGGEAVPITNGTSSRVIESPPFEPVLARLDVRADVVRLASASGTSLFGRFGPGANGDYPLSANPGTVFCTLGSRCTCPADSPGAGTAFTTIDPGRGFMAISGGEHRAAVGVTGQTLDDFCGRPRKTPGPPPGGPAGTGPTSPSGCLNACRTGSSNGDPHLVTFDGLRYDFQAAGEFTLAASADDDMLVQVRQVPYAPGTDVSVNSAVAARVAGDRVVFRLAPDGTVDVRVGGRPAGTGARTRLPGGGVLSRAGGGATVWHELRWPDGSGLYVTPIGSFGLKADMAVSAARAGRLQGLLGDADGDPGDDLDAGGGRLLTKPPGVQPPFADLYGPFADHWRIRQAASLFDYGPGESTATFTDRAFPAEPADAATVPGRADAEQRCRAAGLTDPELLQGCVLDVGLTGRAEFAASAAAQQRFLESQAPPPAQPGGELCRPTSPATFECSGEVTAAQPVPGWVVSLEGFVKLSFAPVPGSDCRIEYALFRTVDAVQLFDFVSVCEPTAVAVDPAPTYYGLVVRGADFTVTGRFGLTLGGTP